MKYVIYGVIAFTAGFAVCNGLLKDKYKAMQVYDIELAVKSSIFEVLEKGEYKIVKNDKEDNIENDDKTLEIFSLGEEDENNEDDYCLDGYDPEE